MSATVFLTVGRQAPASASSRLPSLHGRVMLSWQEIREMHDSGALHFGAHTLTHADLTRLPRDRAKEEICASKSIIEDGLGAPVPTFAYPFGRYDQQSREIVSEHFICGCSTRMRLATTSSDLFLLERVDAYYLRSQGLFGLLVKDYFPLYVWIRSVPRTIKSLILNR
jgi:peptidoglycan/xylan/chitin deacetylase (PgdA/CDA1 family)